MAGVEKFIAVDLKPYLEMIQDSINAMFAQVDFILDGGKPDEIEAIEEMFGVTWDDEPLPA